LLKLGIDIGETSVGRYIVRRRKPPSQDWRTFLENHVKTMVSVDFFTVPTIRFQVLYVFLVLAHDRRRIVHFNVTGHPTAEWTAQQLREAFPFEQIPRYLLRDRDRIFGGEFRKDVKAMGIKEVLSAPRSLWQHAYVERVIGTIRRECLDHVIVLNEASLYRHVKSFLAYYHHESRTHLSLAKDTPEPRPRTRRTEEPWLRSRKLAVFTTAMNGEQREHGRSRRNLYPGTGLPIRAARRDKTHFCAPIVAADSSCFLMLQENRSPNIRFAFVCGGPIRPQTEFTTGT
jgi:Integrase core domain